MKIVKKDDSKKEQEQKEIELQRAYDEKKDEYLAVLRKNKNFQRFVVDGIIKKAIEHTTDLRNIKGGFNNIEEAGKLVLIAQATRIKLESILKELR